MSDPGSDFTSQVVTELNSWFGVHHRVSLTDRHESNGVEGANRDILRHIRAFLSESRLKDRWSEPNIIAWCSFIMNKFDDSESGLPPYELTFGSEAMRYFEFPKGTVDRSTATKFLKILDEDLETARKHAAELQSKMIESRVKSNAPQNTFQPGDFVLHHLPADKPVPSKLVGRYAGPYVVLVQRKNDVSCRHCALGHVKEFFVSDLKLFVGSADEARQMAMLDADQFLVDRFLAYKGDPARRIEMEFLVRFADGSEVWLPWSEDLFTTVQYEDFVRSIPELFPLLHRVKEAKAILASLNKTPITDVAPGDQVFVDIRFYGADWYDAIPLPDKHLKTYVAEHTFGKINRTKLKIEVSSRVLQRSFVANQAFVHQFGQRRLPREHDIVITESLIYEYPMLLSKSVHGKSPTDYEYLVGKMYIDPDLGNRKFEVLRIATTKKREIVAIVKLIREPYSRSKLMDTPVHIAAVIDMVNNTEVSAIFA
jgi:hypothetical protein